MKVDAEEKEDVEENIVYPTIITAALLNPEHFSLIVSTANNEHSLKKAFFDEEEKEELRRRPKMKMLKRTAKGY